MAERPSDTPTPRGLPGPNSSGGDAEEQSQTGPKGPERSVPPARRAARPIDRDTGRETGPDTRRDTGRESGLESGHSGEHPRASSRAAPRPGQRSTPLADGPAGLAPSAIAAIIELLGDEPALGLALVDASARTITGNRRFAALTVPHAAERASQPDKPSNKPPATPPAARRGVWARVGPDAVRAVRTSGGPAMLRFIHEGVQVQCDVWPLPAANAPDAAGGGAGPSDAGEPEAFLVVAVEGSFEPADEPGAGAASAQWEAKPSPALGPGSTPGAGPASGTGSAPGGTPGAPVAPAGDGDGGGEGGGGGRRFTTLAPMLAELGVLEALTARELEVLALIGRGMATRDIAERLGRSPRTVERHCDAIHKKLGTSNRVQMARYAMRAGLTAEAGKLKRV